MDQQPRAVSNVFVALVVMALCAFAAVMYNIYQDDSRQRAVERAERLQSGNQSSALSEIAAPKKNSLLDDLVIAMEVDDQPTIERLIVRLQQSDGADSRLQTAMLAAFDKDNAHAAKILLDAGVLCAADTGFGKTLKTRALRSKNDRLLFMLVKGDCGWNTPETKPTLLQQVAASDYPLRIDYIADANELKSLYSQLLVRFIQAKDPSQALELLYAGANPNATTKDGQQTALELSIRKKLPSVSKALIERNADALIELRDATRDAIILAQEHHQLGAATALLERDSNYLEQAELRAKLITGLRGYSNTREVYGWLQVLLKHGAVLGDSPGTDVSLLRKAIRQSDYQLAEYLLALDVDVNTLLIKTTLLGEARLLATEDGAKIVELLEQHGALDDVLEQVRAKRHSPRPEACDLGREVSIPNFVVAQQQMQKFIRQRDVQKAPDQMALCEHAVVYCRDNGVGVDDCMRSLPTCTDSDQGQYALCCDAEVQASYFEGRCAGLTVKETVMWQDRFSTAYGMPVNF